MLDDEGYLRITDRLKDMFITGGFNVYPAEIEQTLVHYPGVAQAAVIGIADERLGEVAMAFLLPVPGQRIDEAAFLAWCRVQMANYKVPRRVRCWTTCRSMPPARWPSRCCALGSRSLFENHGGALRPIAPLTPTATVLLSRARFGSAGGACDGRNAAPGFR